MTRELAGQPIDWGYLEDGDKKLVVASTEEEGLVYVGSWDEPWDDFGEWARRSYGTDVALRNAPTSVAPYADELKQYFTGQRKTFTQRFALRGTAFQRDVWEAMSRIPYGKTASYADIAAALGKPQASRAVGTAIGRNPVLVVAPCHRIVGKGGSLTGYRGGLVMKRQLLELEGSIPIRVSLSE
ncbi:methylated-DNA--[protein]-cysteine S-methyltransferase [Cohnella suwonensis]|uniref:Methylated-DNA--[protein]-cysteine S-methyltransferase n=1 Tax=Cohnella suwonensis TaxID=696072 RepID=A0ABW0M3V8_9BACL